MRLWSINGVGPVAGKLRESFERGIEMCPSIPYTRNIVKNSIDKVQSFHAFWLGYEMAILHDGGEYPHFYSRFFGDGWSSSESTSKNGTAFANALSPPGRELGGLLATVNTCGPANLGVIP